MIKKSLALIAALFLCVSAVDIDVYVPDADSETDERKATKEDAGILSSLIMTYQTVRNGVKYAYDEIIYLRNIGRTVNSLRDWITGVGERAETLGDQVRTLIVGEGNFFIKLRQLEDVFDSIDDIAVNQVAAFDRHIGKLEHYVDALATNPYADGTGKEHGIVVAPSERIGRLLEWSSQRVPYESIGKLEERERKKALEGQMIFGDVELAHARQEQNIEVWQELDKDDQLRGVVDISNMIATHVMANSRALEQWAVNAATASGKTQGEFAAAGSNDVIGNDMQAAWWMIEQANAKNRELLHQELILKAYMGILGIEIYESSLLQAQRQGQAVNVLSLGM